MKFLVVESETEQEREQRRSSAGKSSGESFGATLSQMVPGCEVTLIEPADGTADPMTAADIARFDAVLLSGSPLHAYDDAPEVRRQLAFMKQVFASGTPAFGSCAGLQIAVVAAGGSVRPIKGVREAGMARRISATTEGHAHPLLAGRPDVWDAATLHSDEVEELPDGATLLASNARAHVQAAEIRHDRGVFWGVQYHPELSPREIGAALRRSTGDLVKEGLARDADDVAAQAELFDRVQDGPDDIPAQWRLGIDHEYAAEDCRRRELANFLASLDRLRGSPTLQDQDSCPGLLECR
jgi:GMP synthase (glutamine-hydrolysing)